MNGVVCVSNEEKKNVSCGVRTHAHIVHENARHIKCNRHTHFRVKIVRLESHSLDHSDKETICSIKRARGSNNALFAEYVSKDLFPNEREGRGEVVLQGFVCIINTTT